MASSSSSRRFLRGRGMGILHSRLNPAAPLPIPGGGSSSALVRLGQFGSWTHHHGRRGLSGGAASQSRNRLRRWKDEWGMFIYVLGLSWTAAFEAPDWRYEIMRLEHEAEAKKRVIEELLRLQQKKSK